MSFQTEPKSSLKTALSKPQQWLEQAIKDHHIRYFDYSCFKDFRFLAVGAFGRVEKAVYNFAGSEVTYALKSIVQLQDANIENKILTEFIKEAST